LLSDNVANFTSDLPVLIMHSRHDELIRFHHAEKNFRLANEPKMFWELQGDHATACGEALNFKEGVEKFLVMIEKTAPKAA